MPLYIRRDRPYCTNTMKLIDKNYRPDLDALASKLTAALGATDDNGWQLTYTPDLGGSAQAWADFELMLNAGRDAQIRRDDADPELWTVVVAGRGGAL